MDTLTVIIIGVLVLLIFDAFLINHLRKKRKDSFKLVIEKGIITQNNGNIPSEFLYDIHNEEIAKEALAAHEESQGTDLDFDLSKLSDDRCMH